MGEKSRQGKNMTWYKRIIYLMIFCTLVVSSTSTVVEAASGAEKKTVRVGYYTAPGFQEYNENTGEYRGLGYEYLMALKQYTGWEYEFVPVEFSDGVQMLENGELDLMNNVSKTAEREELLAFSDYASGSNYGCLVVNADNTDFAYNDFEKFSQMRIGLLYDSIYNSYFQDFCDENGIHPVISYYDTGSEANEAMATGVIDGRIISSSYDSNVRVVAKFAPMDYYFAVPKAEEELLGELNQAMELIRTDIPNLENELEERYQSDYVENAVIMTEAEKKYAKETQNVKVAVSDAWYPISYFDDRGVYTGPLSEVYELLSEATGLQFEFVRYDNYESALDGVFSGETDMISEFPNDFSFADKWNTTLTGMVNQVSIYRITNENYYSGKIEKVAVFGCTYLEEQVKKLYGNDVTYVTVKDAGAAVEAVRTGEVDCTYLNHFQARDFQNRGRYLALKYVLMPSLEYDFCLGVSDNADPALKSLISKGLQTISKDEITEIFQRTAEDTVNPDVDMLFYQNPVLIIVTVSVIAAILVLFLAFLFYYKRIQDKNKELESASRAKTDFLSNMSHEIRTPMNAIIGMTKLAQNEKVENPVVTNYLREIDESSQYLLSILNDVLDMSRIESKRFSLNKLWVQPNKVTNPCLDMIIPMMREKNITFTYEEIVRKDTFYEYYVDVMKTQQLLMNLLNNAYKFTSPGGHVSLSFKNVSINKEQETAVDQIVVEDDGCGMSEEFLQKIFTPFEQERNSYTGPVQGTGLGLALSKSIVNQMGGEISVKSKLGEGSKFTVTFPYQYRLLKDQVKEIVTEVKATGEMELTGKRILLVEDHPLNTMIVTKLLENRGILVSTAENGQIALDMFQKNEPEYYSIILMDIRMPVMDGLECSRRIRKLKRADARTIPIIAMTANAFEEDVKACLEAGMNAHVSKPIDPDKLFETMEQILEK